MDFESDGQAWIIQPNSVSEVGCIHTSQGLEVDYIGVIVGSDLIVRDGKVITQPSERAGTDKSIHGWKARFKIDPVKTTADLDAIIKNTYRTLMTRGQKGCYVYFVDEETRKFFESFIEIPPAVQTSPPQFEQERIIDTFPFRILPATEVLPFKNSVPLYDLKIAAGVFSEEQHPSETEWVELPDVFRPQPGLFVSQVVGESMNRRIPNGSWCLFKANPTGTRQGKVVLAQHREISDDDFGGHYTIKVYESTKQQLKDGTWKHISVVLRPDTNSPGYQEIIFKEDQAEELRVLAEMIAVLG